MVGSGPADLGSNPGGATNNCQTVTNLNSIFETQLSIIMTMNDAIAYLAQGLGGFVSGHGSIPIFSASSTILARRASSSSIDSAIMSPNTTLTSNCFEANDGNH